MSKKLREGLLTVDSNGLQRNTQKYNKHRPIFLLENIFTYKNLYRISRLNTKIFENKITLMRLVMLSGIYCILLQTPKDVWGGMTYGYQASERVHLEVYEGRKLAPITLQKY